MVDRNVMAEEVLLDVTLVEVFVGILIFAASGVFLTTLLDRAERRFDMWRPKVGATA